MGTIYGMPNSTPVPSKFFMPWFSSEASLRGTQFEKLMQWWLVNDPVQKDNYNFTKVTLWSEHTSDPDVGIDLVGVDASGNLWAVQCKAYTDEVISKSKMHDFVAAKLPGNMEPHGRIYITSSNGYTPNALQAALNHDVHRIERSHLDASPVLWPTSEKDLDSRLQSSPVSVVVRNPRPHQTDAIDAVIEALKLNDRAKLLMACGTGKTLTSLWTKEKLLDPNIKRKAPHRTVVLFPSISLLSQTLHEWTTYRSHSWSRLAVCSDQTVVSSRKNVATDLSENMLVRDLDFDVTTDQSSIEKFLKSTDDQIIFATYQSSKQVGQAAIDLGVEFDLVVCDEAHHLAGSLDKAHSSVLDNIKFPAKKRLFMTATPRIITTQAARKATVAGYTISSMDDDGLFGVVAYELNFGKAIAEGLLTDYQVIIAVTVGDAAKVLDVNNYVDVDGNKTTTQDLAATIASAKALKQYSISKAISFHSTIRRSKSFIHILQTLAGKNIEGIPAEIHADHVDGTMSSKVRQDKLAMLKNGSSSHNLLANARCLSEGIDVPALDGVIFVDPRQSEIDIVQAVGRAIRKSGDKKVGTIIIPVVCAADSDGSLELDAMGHKKLRQVLWALRAHDKALGVEIDELLYSQTLSAPGNATKLPAKIIIEIDQEYTAEVLRKFAASISVAVLKAGSPDADWAERYKEVVEYYAKHSSWPSGKDPDNAVKSLGKWVQHQRAQGNKLSDGGESQMTKERYDKLDATPGWLWDQNADAWDAAFTGCLAYYSKHSSWPSAIDPDNAVKSLGTWVSNQRTQGNKLSAGGESNMTQERYDKLDATPGWLWDQKADAWDAAFTGCLAYYSKHSSWPSGKDPDNAIKRLGNWVRTQRAQGNKFSAGSKSKMTQERYDKLTATPGWLWVARKTKI